MGRKFNEGSPQNPPTYIFQPKGGSHGLTRLENIQKQVRAGVDVDAGAFDLDGNFVPTVKNVEHTRTHLPATGQVVPEEAPAESKTMLDVAVVVNALATRGDAVRVYLALNSHLGELRSSLFSKTPINFVRVGQDAYNALQAVLGGQHTELFTSNNRLKVKGEQMVQFFIDLITTLKDRVQTQIQLPIAPVERIAPDPRIGESYQILLAVHNIIDAKLSEEIWMSAAPIDMLELHTAASLGRQLVRRSRIFGLSPIWEIRQEGTRVTLVLKASGLQSSAGITTVSEACNHAYQILKKILTSPI